MIQGKKIDYIIIDDTHTTDASRYSQLCLDLTQGPATAERSFRELSIDMGGLVLLGCRRDSNGLHHRYNWYSVAADLRNGYKWRARLYMRRQTP